MHSFYYKKGANALGAATMAAFGLGAGKMWFDRGGFMLLAFTLLMMIGTAKAALDALSSEPALRFDRHSIWVRKAWGGLVEVPWRDVIFSRPIVLTPPAASIPSSMVPRRGWTSTGSRWSG